MFAQNPVSNDGNTSYMLFQEGLYEQVISNLEKQSDLSTDETIILHLSHLKIGSAKTSDLEKLIKANPDHPLTPLSRFYLGEHYFYNGNSVKSKYYISKTRSSTLSESNQAKYAFIAGAQALKSANYVKASKLLSTAKKLDFDEKDMLTYYLAFSYYHLEKQSAALDGFKESLNNDAYAISSRFFIAKINLDLGKYDEVISLTQKELSEEKSITNSGFYQLIGEAYAKKNDISKADAYFDKAIRVHPSRPSSALHYQAGVSKFKIGNDSKAIKYLTESGIGAGEYAQLSAFQLGRLYLQRKEYENALISYTESSSSKDPVIKEESLYQVAKLHAELAEFTEALNYSNDYIKAFENGQWINEIQDLIAETYLRTSNYDLAIEHLEKIGIVGENKQVVYQKVTFQKAQLLFNDALFSKSILWFNKSLKYSKDKNLVSESHFYIGEAYMAQGQYKNAIEAYTRQTQPSNMTFYGIGYAYYNLENYAKAIAPLERFIKSADDDMKEDGKVRLADCLYATKKYTEALTLYNDLGVKSQSSYVSYQIGLVQRELGKYDEAIASFKKVPNESSWKDNAIYNIASLQFEKANFDEAEKEYTRLIETNPSKSILSKALLNRAVCYSNLNDLKKAKNDFEDILENHLTSSEALSAILGLQELNQKGFPVKNIDNRIADYKSANPNDDSLESIEFEAAKAFYFDLNYNQSIPALSRFMEEYPSSSYLPEAKYYIADSYYRMDSIEVALNVFNTLRTYRNNFTGRVYSRLGEINFRLAEYENAADAYNQLLVLSLSSKDSYNGRYGLMRIYYEQKEYSKCIQTANEILMSEWKPLNAKPIATLYKARSFMGNSNSEMARESFKKIANGTDVISAEANYQLALLEFENGRYQHSLEILFDLNSNFGSYAQWVDKSYLLIADNYLYTNQLFQSKATLRSIIDHSKSQEVIDLAKSRLKDIELQNIVVDSSKLNKN